MMDAPRKPTLDFPQQAKQTQAAQTIVAGMDHPESTRTRRAIVLT